MLIMNSKWLRNDLTIILYSIALLVCDWRKLPTHTCFLQSWKSSFSFPSPTLSRLIQNKFFRILRDTERICVWVFRAYFVKKKFINMHNMLKTVFLAVFSPDFDGSLRLTGKCFSIIFFLYFKLDNSEIVWKRKSWFEPKLAQGEAVKVDW